MIIVDTSVLIDWLRGAQNQKTDSFAGIVKTTNWCISALTYQELLQGVREDSDHDELKEYLETQKIYLFPNALDAYKLAADIYRSLRKKGETIRSMTDTLIAAMAIYNGFELLHNDKDFDFIAKHVPELDLFDR